MASQTPVAIRNENLHIQPGKSALAAKANVPKSEQKGRKERKALADISNAGKPARKPALASTKNAPLLKNKSSLSSTVNVNSVQKTYGLSEDEIKRCNEWARGGIEHVHFSGNDLYNLQNDIAQKDVEKEVESVLSALNGWEGEENKEFGWDLDPEVFLPDPKLQSCSGSSKADDPFLDEFEDLWPLEDYSFEFKLKEDSEDEFKSKEDSEDEFKLKEDSEDEFGAR